MIGFITKIVLSIILVILYVVFAATLFTNISDDIESNIPAIGDVFREETTDEIFVGVDNLMYELGHNHKRAVAGYIYEGEEL